MPDDLVPVDGWPANFQVEAAGDLVSQVTGTDVMQEYSNANTYLNARSIEADGGAFEVPIYPAHFGAATRWAHDAANNGWVNNNTAGADEIVIPLPALHDCTFTDVTISIHGDANAVGPHAGFPWAAADRPRVTLYQIDGTAGTWTNVGNQVDTNNTQATYDVLHTITYTPGAAQTVSATSQYAIGIRGESGVNAINLALVLFGIRMTVVSS
jgi:hypothetical protein